MITLLAILGMVAGAGAVAFGTWNLVRLLTPARKAAALPTGDLERLQAIADVPIGEIIEAAEWRAEHPDEPLPQVLADLDPKTRRPAQPADVPTVPGPPPPPPPAKTRRVIAAANPAPPNVNGFLEQYAAGRKATRGLMVLPEGMTYQEIPTDSHGEPSPAMPGGVVMVPVATRVCEVSICERNPDECGHSPAPLDMSSLPVLSAVWDGVQALSRYSGCKHPEATRQQLMSHGSETPIREFVTECERCDLITKRTRLADQMKEALAGLSMDEERGFLTATRASVDLIEVLRRDLNEVDRQLRVAEAANPQDFFAHTITWP